uniref:G-protein coupled receptors family 1 profile domain-containing protein n=1 Tax=Panagrellus redivivus TaxID=6233 RepID=A0A7E4VJ03_PANRE
MSAVLYRKVSKDSTQLDDLDVKLLTQSVITTIPWLINITILAIIIMIPINIFLLYHIFIRHKILFMAVATHGEFHQEDPQRVPNARLPRRETLSLVV